MTTRDELLQAIMHYATAHGGAALVDDIALSWWRIVQKFSPLIGATSVALIVERSLEYHLAAFAWLPGAATPTRPDSVVERLRTSMAAQPADEILAAHRALLTTFIDLTTTLIGARLTDQFLRAAFPANSAGSTTEEKPG